MEDALVLYSVRQPKKTARSVLILVLMEDALVPANGEDEEDEE